MNNPDYYSHPELLFALQIRHFAHQIRADLMPEEVRQSKNEHDRTRWIEENPLPKFVKLAVKEALDTAAEIRKIGNELKG